MITSKLYSISCLPSLLLRQLEYISQMLKEFIYYSYQFELKQEEDPI